MQKFKQHVPYQEKENCWTAEASQKDFYIQRRLNFINLFPSLENELKIAHARILILSCWDDLFACLNDWVLFVLCSCLVGLGFFAESRF